MKTAKALGILIACRREQLGMSVKELAFKTGRSVTYIKQTEKGRGKMDWETLRDIVSALRMPRKDFIDILFKTSHLNDKDKNLNL